MLLLNIYTMLQKIKKQNAQFFRKSAKFVRMTLLKDAKLELASRIPYIIIIKMQYEQKYIFYVTSC